jgi:hypothetical protein
MVGQPSGPFYKQRRAARQSLSRYAARVVSDGAQTVWCEVVDISKTGAKLSGEQLTGLPDTFTLLLSTQGSAQRNCRVVWRGEGEIGVRFL